MSARRNFDSRYVESELQKLSSKLGRKTVVYVAGGAAMALTNLKEATKDIDVVVATSDEVKSLVSGLRLLGYRDPRQSLTIKRIRMFARDILENPDGFRWDIFEKVVANKLYLSEGMIERSQSHLSSNTLSVRLLSKEDIFLLKSVTDRERDLEDMKTVAESSPNWKTIDNECRWQTAHSNRTWEDDLCNRLQELKANYGITSPIQKRICKVADEKVLEEGIKLQLRKGTNTVKDIAREIGEPESTVRKALAGLVEKRIVSVHRSKKPHEFAMKTDPKEPIYSNDEENRN